MTSHQAGFESVEVDICVPNERDDIKGRGIVGVAQEVHQSMDDTGSHLGEFDGSDMDRLNEKLAVFRCLERF